MKTISGTADDHHTDCEHRDLHPSRDPGCRPLPAPVLRRHAVSSHLSRHSVAETDSPFISRRAVYVEWCPGSGQRPSHRIGAGCGTPSCTRRPRSSPSTELTSVTMTRVAEVAGIGRATLYKYFPDVESILEAWHAAEVAAHLDQLGVLAHETVDPKRRLEQLLHAYAEICLRRSRHDRMRDALLHRWTAAHQAERSLIAVFSGVLRRLRSTLHT